MRKKAKGNHTVIIPQLKGKPIQQQRGKPIATTIIRRRRENLTGKPNLPLKESLTGMVIRPLRGNPIDTPTRLQRGILIDTRIRPANGKERITASCQVNILFENEFQ